MHKGQGKKLTKLVIDLRSNFFATGQLYVELSRTRKSTDVLLMHKDDDSPLRADFIHPMPVSVSNPVPRQAIEFVQGTESWNIRNNIPEIILEINLTNAPLQNFDCYYIILHFCLCSRYTIN